jgi:hypothetical protein
MIERFEDPSWVAVEEAIEAVETATREHDAGDVRDVMVDMLGDPFISLVMDPDFYRIVGIVPPGSFAFTVADIYLVAVAVRMTVEVDLVVHLQIATSDNVRMRCSVREIELIEWL